MHPGMFAWWNARRREAFGECGESAGCGPRGGPWGRHSAPDGEGHGHGHRHGHSHGADGVGGGDEFGGFGVRRPLRFLAFKLELDEPQVTELAAILSELKTERAQSSVDQRRTTASLAEAVAGESFDQARAKAAAEQGAPRHRRSSISAGRTSARGRIPAVGEAIGSPTCFARAR